MCSWNKWFYSNCLSNKGVGYKIIEIILDLDDGSVVTKYYDEKSDRLLTGIDVVDNDECIQKINNEIQDLYSSYYKINYNNQPVYFDKDQEKR